MPHPSLQELLNNATALPSIPRIVQQVLKELDNEDPNPRNVVMLVSTDCPHHQAGEQCNVCYPSWNP